MGSISNLSSSYLQAILGNGLQGVGITAQTNSQTGLSGIKTSDSQQLSPFAQLVNTLQQLQQSDPTKYKQVTAQIANNLQTAAQSAQSSGNTAAANQLNQLATDFSSASSSGQLPNLQDLALAIGGGHHGHHHHAHASSSTDSDGDASAAGASGSSTPTSGSTSSNTVHQALSQIFSLLGVTQSAGTQANSFDPGAIILNTLQNAGVTSATGF